MQRLLCSGNWPKDNYARSSSQFQIICSMRHKRLMVQLCRQNYGAANFPLKRWTDDNLWRCLPPDHLNIEEWCFPFWTKYIFWRFDSWTRSLKRFLIILYVSFSFNKSVRTRHLFMKRLLSAFLRRVTQFEIIIVDDRFVRFACYSPYNRPTKLICSFICDNTVNFSILRSHRVILLATFVTY